MKKIINKRRYDTESAARIGSYENNLPGDLNYISETLHRKRNGEYFLHCEGGANTKYCRKLSANSWAPGETLIPITAAEAEAWGREHLTEAAYNAQFGAIQEDATHVTRTYSMSAETLEILRRLVAKNGGTISGMIEKAVREKAAEEGII